MTRINVKEILSENISIDEPIESFLTDRADYELSYLKGDDVFQGSDELFIFLENKAYQLIDRNGYNVLTTIGFRQLGIVEQYGSGVTQEIIDAEPTGRNIYSIGYYYKKAVQAQIFYWNKNKQIVELNRARQISDSGTNYSEGPTGFGNPFDEICNEAKTYIGNSGIKSLIFEINAAIESGSDEQIQFTLNKPGFVGMFKDGFGTDQVALQELLTAIKDLQNQFPAGEFAQTELQVESLADLYTDQSLLDANNKRDNLITSLSSSISLLEKAQQDGTAEVNFPTSDIIVPTNQTFIEMPLVDETLKFADITGGRFNLNKDIQTFRFQFDVDWEVSSLGPSTNARLELWIGIRNTIALPVTITYLRMRSRHTSRDDEGTGTVDIALNGSVTIDTDVLVDKFGMNSRDDLQFITVSPFARVLDPDTGSYTIKAGTPIDLEDGIQTGWYTVNYIVGLGVVDAALISFLNLSDTFASYASRSNRALVVNNAGDGVDTGNEFYDPNTPIDNQFKIVSTDGSGKVPSELVDLPITNKSLSYGFGTAFSLITDLTTALFGDKAYKSEEDLPSNPGVAKVTESHILLGSGDFSDAIDWIKTSIDPDVISVNGQTNVVQLDANHIPYNDTTGRLNANELQTAVTNILPIIDAKTFLSPSDTPGSYSGQAFKRLRVKSTEDGVEFTDTEETFEGDVIDTRENAVTGEIEFKIRIPIVDDGVDDAFLPWTIPVNRYTQGVTGQIINGKFINGNDTPPTYVGQATKLLAVNVAETAVEFIEIETKVVSEFKSSELITNATSLLVNAEFEIGIIPADEIWDITLYTEGSSNKLLVSTQFNGSDTFNVDLPGSVIVNFTPESGHISLIYTQSTKRIFIKNNLTVTFFATRLIKLIKYKKTTLKVVK